MCDLSGGAPTTANPSDVSGGGGGSTSGKQTCCPDVARFLKRSQRSDYFGFDDVTNKVKSGKKPYWDPPSASKTAPGPGTERDGSVWLSIEKGDSTTCTLKFENNTKCIGNCSFEYSSAGKATVENSAVTTNNVKLKINGVSAGETTIQVKCDGKDIGWVHVAVYDIKSFKVAVCEVNQKVPKKGKGGGHTLRLPRPSRSVAAFQTFFDDAWRDAAVRVELEGIPVHYVETSDIDLSAGGDIWDADGNPSFQHIIDNFATMTGHTDTIHAAVSAANPGYDKYIYLMVAPGDMSGRNVAGFASSIPGDYGFFFNQGTGSLSTACHEFGHMIGLRHLNDDAGRAQFPEHLQIPKGDENVSPHDNFNLMGYGGPRGSRKRLRYLQWKAVPGR